MENPIQTGLNHNETYITFKKVQRKDRLWKLVDSAKVLSSRTLSFCSALLSVGFIQALTILYSSPLSEIYNFAVSVNRNRLSNLSRKEFIERILGRSQNHQDGWRTKASRVIFRVTSYLVGVEPLLFLNIRHCSSHTCPHTLVCCRPFDIIKKTYSLLVLLLCLKP